MFKISKDVSILVVCEESKNRAALSTRLGHFGYQAEQAKSGFHCMHMMEKKVYNFILISHEMTEMKAEELISLIRDQSCADGLGLIMFDVANKAQAKAYLHQSCNEAILEGADVETIVKKTREYIDLVTGGL